MKALHIREVDELVIHRIARLARFHRRSMQAELRGILEEAAARAKTLENDEGDELIMVAAEPEGGYGREALYGDDAR